MDIVRRRPARALLVCESCRFREAVIAALERQGDFEVAAVVSSSRSARERGAADVDLVVVGDGDERATTIGVPVVVVGEEPIEGAPPGVYYVTPPSGEWQTETVADLLAARIRQAARVLLRRAGSSVAQRAPVVRFAAGQIVAIAASTGGTEAVRSVLKALPATCPPIVIVQHIPAAFSAGFARRLHDHSALDVREAKDGEVLAPGSARLAPGDLHLAVDRVGGAFVARVFRGERVHNLRPAADVLMRSIARAAQSNAVGVVLTGMGEDGAAGLLAMRDAGARTIAESPETCAVFGMPREAIERGAAERTVPLPAIAGAVLACLKQDVREAAPPVRRASLR